MGIAEESTRSRLLDAAEDLFAAKAFEAVGIREIAERAGVNLSGIKYHFGSKRGLYLETVRRAMDRRGSNSAWEILREPPASPPEAAARFAAFVRAFLAVLLSDEESNGACLVMQSALGSGDATDLVVDEFVRPHHEQLMALIGALRPESSERQRSLHAQSIMGQIMHQRIFREFLDRLEPAASRRAGFVDELAQQITRFSLQGMGCEPHALAAADESQGATR